MRRFLSLSLSAALIAGAAGHAAAAGVAVLKGASQQVAVQSGGGVVAADAGSPLSYGDRIVTGPEGNAVVSFAGGKCAGDHKVPPSALATLSENSCLEIVTGVKAEVEWTMVALVGGVVVGGGILAYELSKPNSP